jgi:hypothetical protein
MLLKSLHMEMKSVRLIVGLREREGSRPVIPKEAGVAKGVSGPVILG